MNPLFLCAGEASGDLLAADLARALQRQCPGLPLIGIAGDEMRAAGVEALRTNDDMALMGFAEVVGALSHYSQIEQLIIDSVLARGVRVAILIDFPGFHFRLARKLKERGIRVIQYVAPKVWAWGEQRLSRLRNDFDLLLGILPFEEEYFRSREVPHYHYVGCPHRERTEGIEAAPGRFGCDPSRPVVALLPGSRVGEFQRIMPLLTRIAVRLKGDHPDCQFLVPLAPSLQDRIELPEPGLADFHFVPGQSLEVMAAADAGIVTSGTATLEGALVGLPQVVLYVMGKMTYWLAKRRVQIDTFSLINLIAQRPVVSEHIQFVDEARVAQELGELLAAGPRREAMLSAYEEIRQQLPAGAAERAAETILGQPWLHDSYAN